MIKEKLLKIISFNGIVLIIGILGGLSSILTIFITQWNVQISLKWFVFFLFVFLIILLILIKLIYELNREINVKRPNLASVIRYIPSTRTLLVTKNDFLGYSAMVSIFYYDELYEVEIGKGYVTNITERFIQIRILDISDDFNMYYHPVLERFETNDLRTLQMIVVKSYITYTN